MFDDGMEAEDQVNRDTHIMPLWQLTSVRQFTQGQEVGHMKMKVAEAKGVGYNNVVSA